jgi:hypothetical protein
MNLEMKYRLLKADNQLAGNHIPLTQQLHY